MQFPGDYDGIIAGAPAIMNTTHQAAGHVWDYDAFNSSPVNITVDQRTAVTDAILKQCAGKDGGLSSDNFLTDPRDCHWDPAALQCTGGAGDAATCLMVPQVAAMRKYFKGPINPYTGERIYAGRMRESESENVQTFPVGRSASTGSSTYWVFGNDFDCRRKSGQNPMHDGLSSLFLAATIGRIGSRSQAETQHRFKIPS